MTQSKQASEPAWWHVECDDPDYSGFFQERADAIQHASCHGGTPEPLFAAAQPEQASEPVAWKFPRRYGSGLSFVRPADYTDEDGRLVQPEPLCRCKHPAPPPQAEQPEPDSVRITEEEDKQRRRDNEDARRYRFLMSRQAEPVSQPSSRVQWSADNPGEFSPHTFDDDVDEPDGSLSDGAASPPAPEEEQPERALSDAEIDAALKASDWPKSMLSDFVIAKLYIFARACIAASREKNVSSSP